MRKTIALLITLIIISIISGCANQKSSEKLIEPETLISKAEAEQLLGQSLKDPEKKEKKAVGMKLAIYDTIKEGTGKFLQVGITQQSFMPANGQSPKAIFDSLKGNFKNATMVSGIGDDAFIAPPGLHILYKERYITIAVGNSDNEKNREILKTAGKKALENLDKTLGN